MSLSEKGRAYREPIARCPGCGEAMGTEITRSAEVDACSACGGVWVDWFDGELATLAAEAEQARVERGTPPPGMLSTARRDGGSRACPRCARELVAELHRFADARADELITGIELLRCPECAGSFVPRSSAHLLFERAREERRASIGELIVALGKALLRRG